MADGGTPSTDGFDEFRVKYARDDDDGVLGEIEYAVTGESYGANGYTTRRQADLIGERLGLGPGTRLLDTGTGCGWPALYLAVTTGCSVVATDVPIEGLRRAAQRINTDSIDAHVVASSAQRPPFPPASFDAITHTDVLC